MKIVAIMPARNEGWVIGLSASAVLRWADSLIVLDHASTDSTPDILRDIAREHSGRVGLIRQDDAQWPEMEHRQMLLAEARKAGATHIATIDADEVLTANLVPDIRGMFAACPAGAILQLPWQCLRGSIGQVHQSGVWASQFASSGFPDDPLWHWSSAERGGYQYHHRHPMGKPLIPYRPVGFSRGGLMHLQFVDDRRLRAKQALYKMQEVVRWPGRMSVPQINDYYDLSVYGDLLTAAIPQEPKHDLARVPVEWWRGYDDILSRLATSAIPYWQEVEVNRLLTEHGTAKFAGLDLFGVVNL